MHMITLFFLQALNSGLNQDELSMLFECHASRWLIGYEFQGQTFHTLGMLIDQVCLILVDENFAT